MGLLAALPFVAFSITPFTSRHLAAVSPATPFGDMGRHKSAWKTHFCQRSASSSTGMMNKLSTRILDSTPACGTRTTRMNLAANNDDDSMSNNIVISTPIDKDSCGVCGLSLRNATIDDLDMVLAWDENEHLQDSGGDIDFNDWNWEYELPRNPTWRYQLIGSLHFMERIDDDASSYVGQANMLPIGFVQIIDPKEEETHYWGEPCESGLRAIDIWIGEEDYIGQGYGTKLMKLALKICFEGENDNASTVNAVLIDPMYDNKAAHRFYQRLGFQPIGERYFGPDRCLVHRLNRTDYFAALTENK